MWQQLLSDQVGSILFFPKISNLSCSILLLPLKHFQCNSYKSFSASLLQSLFRAWLVEKEEALNEVQNSNFRDPNKMNTNVLHLAVSCIRFLQLLCEIIYLALAFLPLLKGFCVG